MEPAAIIKELRCIESEAEAFKAGLERLHQRSYSLRKKLEGIVSPASPGSRKRQEKIAADSSVRFGKKMAKKTTK